MNRNDKITKLPVSTEPQAPKFPELYTDDELANYGEVVSTTCEGQVFVLKDDVMYLFQPVACKHFNHEEYYYNKVEFK